MVPLAVLLLLAGIAGTRAADEIVIGAVLTLSGEAAGAGQEALEGVERGVEALNGAGGIEVAGVFRPVRLEVFDDQGSNRRAEALARVLVLRRGAAAIVVGPRPAAGLALAPVGDVFAVPIVDIAGLPASEAAVATPYLFSVLPSLEDRWMPALTFAVLVRRMQETEPDAVPFRLVADDPLLARTAQGLAAAWGLEAKGDTGAPGDTIALVLDRPASWPEPPDFGPGIVIVPQCDDAEALRSRRPVGALLCTALWQRDGLPVASEMSISAEVAVLAVAQAIYRGRSAYGPVLRDVMALLDTATPYGPLRFGADGRNAALAARLYAVEPGGLRVLDAADPASLWLDEP